MNSNDKNNTVQKELDRDELWLQLGNSINLRSSEDQVLWTIFGAFLASNAILLVALFTTGDLPKNSLVGLVVSFFGILLSMIWHGIQQRALGHVKRHENLMKTIEENLRFDPSFAVSPEINQSNYDQSLPKGISARRLMPLCSVGGILIWALAFVLFVAKSLDINLITAITNICNNSG